jgi:hypothetical protein
VPWETFYTYGESTVYGEGSLAELRALTAREANGDPSALEATGTCCGG